MPRLHHILVANLQTSSPQNRGPAPIMARDTASSTAAGRLPLNDPPRGSSRGQPRPPNKKQIPAVPWPRQDRE